MPSSFVLLLRAEQTMAVRLSVRLVLCGSCVSRLLLPYCPACWVSLGSATHLTTRHIFSAYLPTAVPPNFCTIQPPGRCFSAVCAILSDWLVNPFIVRCEGFCRWGLGFFLSPQLRDLDISSGCVTMWVLVPDNESNWVPKTAADAIYE